MTKIRKVMKTNKLMMSATAFLLLLAGVGCGNRTTKAESTAAAAEAAVGEALQIDDLLAGADSLAGKEVWIEGVCTHACKHGARKIFLMGRMTQNIIYNILIHIELTDETGLKITSFQFNYHITAKFQMIEQKINIKVISAHFQMYLSAYKRKSLSQLQKKVTSCH